MKKPAIAIEPVFQRWADRYYALLPQPTPTSEKLRACKIVSHRGEHDNKWIFENTVEAFDPILTHDGWGVEVDIRWTKDLHPVVIHDSDCRRLYQTPLEVAQTPLLELRRRVPLIPTLEDVIRRYGKKLHLMVELKKEFYPDPEKQTRYLKSLFCDLSPGEDFHFISLKPHLFQYVPFVPNSALLPVSTTNFNLLSTLALRKQYGGITGHYAFLNDSLHQRHRNQGQKLGTGFIASKNCLFREINRDIEWIFSNHALKLLYLRNKWIKRIT
ncbi:glycerophosphodiester phosphodiesterase family protein [Deltaproteobacteria bacterium TL4]